jgi:hypothetical protein
MEGGFVHVVTNGGDPWVKKTDGRRHGGIARCVPPSTYGEEMESA